MEAIKPIFRDLAKPDLLSKCLHGKTQNVNEALNQLIWKRCPKDLFVGSKTVEMGVADAVATYNDGAITIARVLNNLGITPGEFTMGGIRATDNTRIAKADRKILKAAKSRRKVMKQLKKKKHEPGADAYGYGAH
jgi:hypothetical protein